MPWQPYMHAPFYSLKGTFSIGPVPSYVASVRSVVEVNIGHNFVPVLPHNLSTNEKLRAEKAMFSDLD